MTELNEYECEMLDVLLEAFGVPDSLTRTQVLSIFDGDETSAFTMVQILLREGLVAEVGQHGPYELPDKLVLKPKGEKLLRDGGFVRLYRSEQAKPVEVGGTLTKLQQQNMRLQNEKLSNQAEISRLKGIIDRQRLLLYISWALIVVAFLIGWWLGHKR